MWVPWCCSNISIATAVILLLRPGPATDTEKEKEIDILNSHKHAITFKQTFDYTR